MKILAIGNSFTQDALRYLHDMAKARGVATKCVNLVIGGCSLERHYRNMLSEMPMYALEINGEPTGFMVSLKAALASDCFDVVTVQQASHYSVKYETFQPYITELATYIRRFQPHAKLYIQQTWAYEDGSHRLVQEQGFATHSDMFEKVQASYHKAMLDIGADGIIPSGRAMELGVLKGLKMHRDTFHAGLATGRYLISLVWQQTLLGLSAKEDQFATFDTPLIKEEMEILRECAYTACVER